MKAAALFALPLLALPLLAAQSGDFTFARPTLNVQQGGTRDAEGVVKGGTYALVKSIDVPANHLIHDRLIAFEGPGWESEKVAYRLYLDQRNVPDIYGKRLPGRILPRIGQGLDDYHSLADWGMDIFQVDASLGMGGIGVERGGKATQLGPSTIHAEVTGDEGKVSAVTVTNKGFDNGAADLVTRYALDAGSRVTQVSASVAGTVPQMVAGLRHHDGTMVVRSAEKGAWRYVATWGRQSLNHDNLGIVLFYPAANVTGVADDGVTLYVRFRDSAKIRYGFAAAWEQEPGAPKTLGGFTAWLDRVDAALEAGKAPDVD